MSLKIRAGRKRMVQNFECSVEKCRQCLLFIYKRKHFVLHGASIQEG